MASQCASDNADKVPGVIFSSYPLHPPGKEVRTSCRVFSDVRTRHTGPYELPARLKPYKHIDCP